MRFDINNSRDLICDKLFLLDTNDVLQNVLDLIANGGGGGGGGGGGITTLTGSGAAVITGSATSKNITVDLSMFSTTTQIINLLNGKVNNNQVLTNVPSGALFTDTVYSKPASEPISYITGLQTALNAKQNTLTAGNNITISNNTISSSGGTQLNLQVNGVAQTATTLNFVQNNALLSNGVLNISRLEYYDKIPLIFSGVSSIKDLKQGVNGGLSWGTDIVTTNNHLTTVLSSYETIANVNSLLTNYTTTSALTTLLNAKQNTLTAGSNITISNNTISATGGGSGGSSLVLQVDGVTQTATTLNFLQNNALLSNGVLNVSRLTHYDKIPLIYSGVSSIKDITQDVNSNLLWGTDILTTNNHLTTVLGSYATTAALSNYTTTSAMTTLLNGKVDDGQVLTDVPQNAVFTDTLYSKPANEPISYITGLQTALNAKQNTLTAGSNITITGNTISSSGGSSGNHLMVQLDGVTQSATAVNFIANNAILSNGILNVSRLNYYDKIQLIYSSNASIKDLKQDVNSNLLWGTDILTTQAWVTANFLSPLNPGTVGVTAGLSATMNANSLVISVDQNFDRRNLFILEDANLVLRNITCNTAGKLLYDNVALATETHVTTQLATKQDTLNGVSSGQFLYGPAHWFSAVYSYSWVNQTTHSVFTSKGSEPDMYGVISFQVGRTYTIKADVKLVGSSSVFVLGFEYYANGWTTVAQTFTTANGLNTSTYTTISLSWTATTTSGYWEMGFVDPNYTGAKPSAGNVYHLQNVSVQVEGVSITGDLNITGTMTAATKSFDIVHPDPDKSDYRLRHWCIESDTPGGMVMYTKTVDMSTTSETFSMPDWFKYLTKDVIVFVTPFKHFGSGWGECVANELQVHTTTKGQWNILITATRNDHCSKHMCPQEVEYSTIVAPIIDEDMRMPPK